MKKVLFVATVDIHIKKFHLPYLRMFKNKGYEVHVATNGAEQFTYCDKKHQLSIEREPLRICNLKAIIQLKKIIKEEKFDIIHCHTPMGSVVARIAAIYARKKYGTRVIYTAHGFHFYKGAPIINWILFYPIERYLAKYTDTLITINREDYELAKKKLNNRCNDIQYVPGVGVDIKKFDIKLSDDEKNNLKKTFNLKEKYYVLTCVARLDNNKNQGFLINVMKELVRDYNNIHLLLVGPDELDGHYQKIVEKNCLNNNVHFLGIRDDIPNILAITDIVVSASKREGLPVNVLEAFAARKPVIALNCRGMKDLIEDDVNGFIIDNASNPKLFAEKIITIYNLNESKRKEIMYNNYKKVTDYNIQNIANKFLKIYF